MEEKTPRRSQLPASRLYGQLKARRRWSHRLPFTPLSWDIWVEYLCVGCRGENALARRREDAERARRLAEVTCRYVEWLRRAPLWERLPAQPSRVTGDTYDTFAPLGPFVEVLEVAAAARLCAAAALDHAPALVTEHYPGDSSLWVYGASLTGEPPSGGNYRDKLSLSRSEKGVHNAYHWRGSVYRLADGRTVLHWHTWRRFDQYRD